MNKKTIKVISIICVLGIIMLMFIYFNEIYKTKDYIKTKALITANIENTDLGTNNNSNSNKYKYVEVKYEALKEIGKKLVQGYSNNEKLQLIIEKSQTLSKKREK